MAKKKAIGIDLGTSKCCVGVVRDGKVEILENERGNKTTPSYVAFTDTERLVGEDAKDQATLNPANTVFGVKRIIGREWNDGLLGEAIDKMPYTIMNKNEGETCIHVSYKDEEEFLLPQQITAMLLGKMKDLAELHLKSKVDEAVISVPASFSNAQRQATKDAAAIAGLKVLALINEPTAAAIAYQANRRKTDEENVAVVDFGAGKLDVAIVTVRRDRVTVKAVSGSTSVGGDDIDEVLIEYVGKKFEDQCKNKLPESPAIKERLRSCCEKLKRKLTLLPKVQEMLDCFGDDYVLPVTVNREDFKAMMPEVMQSSLKICLRRAAQASGIFLKDVSRVVMVGGSSRIPLFQTWLEEMFGSTSLDRSVNPDEAVAHGATLYAALLGGDNELDEFAVQDCFPNDYCFSCKGDSNMQPVFEQLSGNNLPHQRVVSFNGQSPFNENTRAHTFEFHEELSGQKNPHRLIGTLCLEDEFRQAVRLITAVIFEIDSCGIFNVIVQLRPDHSFPEVVRNYCGKLTIKKLKNAVEREQLFRKDDQDERERVEAMSSLEALSFGLQSALGESKAKELFPELVKQISDKVKENIQWLDATNTVPKMKCVTREKSLKKLNNRLELQLQEHNMKEQERVATVKKLIDDLVGLAAFVSSADVSEEREFAAEIERELAKTKQWLESTDTPSTNDCTKKGGHLDQLRISLEDRLKKKRQETERVKAINNLLEYCNHLETTMVNDSNAEAISGLTKQLIEQARGNLCWLNISADIPSKADCDRRKEALKSLYDRAEAERAAIAEADRAKAAKTLKSFCNRLTNNLFGSRKVKECDPALVEFLEKKVNSVLYWLESQTVISKDECIKKHTELVNLEKTVLDSIDEYKRLEEKRSATQKMFESEIPKIKSSILNKEARNIDSNLVRQITEQIDDLGKWLKQRNQFSEHVYTEKFSNMECLIKELKVKLSEANSKTLSDKANGELSSFEKNGSPAIGHGHGRGAGTGAHERSSSEDDPKNKSTPASMASSNEAATALQARRPADTQGDKDRKNNFKYEIRPWKW